MMTSKPALPSNFRQLWVAPPPSPRKKINGCKRHVITDTQGFILGCYVGPANENDRDGIKPAICNMQHKYAKVKKMWADMGYQGKNLKEHIKKEYDIEL